MQRTDLICEKCGFIGQPRQFEKLPPIGGCLLLFLFIIPGIIYFMFKSSSDWWGCPSCQAPNMIPVTSFRGGELLTARGMTVPPAVPAPAPVKTSWQLKLLIAAALLFGVLVLLVVSMSY